MTMTAVDDSTGARGSLRTVAGALKVAGLMTVNQTDAYSATVAIGALAANTDYFTPAISGGPGAIVTAQKYGPNANASGDILELQHSVSQTGPWFAMPGAAGSGIARFTTADALDSVIATRGHEILPWMRVRYRSTAAVLTGGSIGYTVERSSR